MKKSGREQAMEERRTSGGYRNKMRDECVAMHAILLKRRRIHLRDLAEELGISTDTARRWVGSFSLTGI